SNRRMLIQQEFCRRHDGKRTAAGNEEDVVDCARVKGTKGCKHPFVESGWQGHFKAFLDMTL
ncbi:hypothetical protein, partial [Staphylococcus aureus]|uniref:hypothetical protein n=1 Tax=Staphylococcus aureus TaxID=1280 RepID=UPI0038B40EA8